MSIITQFSPSTQSRNFLPTLVMETNSNPVTAGGSQAGWVSGDPRSMAINTTVFVLFDLGPDWSFYPVIQNSFLAGTATSGLTIRFHSSDTTTFPVNNQRRLMTFNYGAANGNNAAFYTVSTVGPGPIGSYFRPMGRYLHVQITTDGTGTTNTTTTLTIAAYPHA